MLNESGPGPTVEAKPDAWHHNASHVQMGDLWREQPLNKLNPVLLPPR